MREYDKRTCTRIVCDLCGAECRDPEDENWSRRDRSQWHSPDDPHEMQVSEISCRHHTCYDVEEGAWGTTYTIDLCPWCFMDRLLPWIRENGGTVHEEDNGF